MSKRQYLTFRELGLKIGARQWCMFLTACACGSTKPLSNCWKNFMGTMLKSSVCHLPEKGHKLLRCVCPSQSGGSREGARPVTCPPIVSTYNQYMGGVDKNDQMKSYYQISVTGKKWWTRLLFDLIDRAIYNSLVLHNESPNHRKKDLKTFQNELAKDLVDSFSSRRKRGRASLEQPQARFVERHFPACLPCNESGKRMERRCTVCTANKSKKKTSFYCPDCDVGLCAALCFRIFTNKTK